MQFNLGFKELEKMVPARQAHQKSTKIVLNKIDNISKLNFKIE